jgi:hypothetical protein
MTGATDRTRSRLAFGTVLFGAVVFLVSLFLPFVREGSESNSIFAAWSAWTAPGRLAGYLHLFGGIAVIALIAAVGLTRPNARTWAPSAIPVVVAAWSFPWIGRIVGWSTTGRDVHLDAGFWSLIAALVALVAGAVGAALTGRRNHERTARKGSFVPRPAPRYGYAAVLAAIGVFAISLTLPLVKFGSGPAAVSTSAISLWELFRRIAESLTFLGGLITIAAIAIVGIRIPRAGAWVPRALIGTVAVWAFFWVASLLTLFPGFNVQVGFWALILSVALTAWGAVDAFLTARDAQDSHPKNAG